MKVDVHHPPRREVVLIDEAPDLHDAGVVDQHVKRPQLPLGLVEEGRKGVAIGHVEWQRDRSRPELGSGLARRVEIDVADRHLHAVAQERFRRRAADATRASGDRGCLSGEDSGCFGHGAPCLSVLACVLLGPKASAYR